MKILILCTGNSCRSQIAHGWLHSFDHSIEVCSAGTHPAECVNPLAIKVMSEVGVDISKHVPKNVRNFIDETWDYVITVCGDANETCPAFVGKVNHRLHFGFDDPSKVKGEESFVLNEFQRVRDEIKETFFQLYSNNIKTYKN